ncbi:MAG: hypothetical protein Q8Q59_10100 [Luteolibacter sp.]|jgi:hypothetical protein|nr:hypothetical protein [Luteolibacter sp.]
MNSRAWLADVPWEMVVWQNEQLCKPKNAHHEPTSDGHAECRELWEESRMKMMSLDEMVDLCRVCHRLAPFTNYNGNTFSAIARALIDTLDIPSDTAVLARSLAGHIVAGVASDEEVLAFRKFCEGLD